MAAFPPLFLKVRSEGDAHSMAQMQAHQLTWAAREREGSRGRGVGPGWDQLVQETTSFVMHLGEEPAHSWAARGTYMVVSML